MTRLVTVGKITTVHGVQGWVKALPLTDDPGRFEELGSVALAREDGKPGGGTFNIEGVKYQKDRALLKFAEVGTREDAEKLKNMLIQVPEERVPRIEEEGVYYYYQLEGLIVMDAAGEKLGVLDSIFQTGSNDVYVVRGEGKTEYYVPALKACIQKVDIEGGVMIVDREYVT